MRKKIIIGVLILIVILTSFYLYVRYVGTKGLKVKEYKVEANITDNFHGLKIVHFSDLYYMSTIDKNDLTRVIDKINLIKPDIVVFTGDLVNKNIVINDEIRNDLISLLSKIDTTIGKYSVYGENDSEEFISIMEKSNFNILNNNYDLIYKDNNEPILLAGISCDKTLEEKMTSIYEYINNNEIQYKILLMHEPDNVDKINGFNLILSGHSLNNQINVPIMSDLFKVNGARKYYSEYYEINNTKLYVSSGLGTNKYKVRLFNKPSFNFYRIVKESRV